MQTFLPYPDFSRSMEVLDWRRLGKQRVEARQVLTANLLGPGAAWYNHPATRMWRGYDRALIAYGNCAIAEWIARGYRNNMPLIPLEGDIHYPEWWGMAELHESHRSMLMYKLPNHYEYLFADHTRPGLSYVWPTPVGEAD